MATQSLWILFLDSFTSMLTWVLPLSNFPPFLISAKDFETSEHHETFSNVSDFLTSEWNRFFFKNLPTKYADLPRFPVILLRPWDILGPPGTPVAAVEFTATHRASSVPKGSVDQWLHRRPRPLWPRPPWQAELGSACWRWGVKQQLGLPGLVN